MVLWVVIGLVVGLGIVWAWNEERARKRLGREHRFDNTKDDWPNID